MVSATKTGQNVGDAGESSGAGKLLQDKAPRDAEWLAKIEKFRNGTFVGGTFVQHSRVFQGAELGRSKVTEVSIEGTMLRIKSEGQTEWNWHDIDHRLSIREINGVFYLDGPYCGNPCAIAPAGVDIPKRETIKEVLTRMPKPK